MDDYDRDMNRPIDDDNRDDDNDLGRQGMGDQLKGKMNEATGNVQRKVGDVTDNEDMEAEGEERKLKGKMQQGLGNVESSADDLLDR
ncbi:MAG TPA: CsbD family protein [Ktedonobacterales bacterium]|jgi:uncharacterized protein YjbJ (UPF0337 family)|nr:CsbD family protein [Ktedonobacterales bacterium]